MMPSASKASDFKSNLFTTIMIPLGQRKAKYLRIDDDKRRIILFEVMVMKTSLKTVCLKHDINFSSAKNVIQIFKKEGRLVKKVHRVRKSKIGSKADSNNL